MDTFAYCKHYDCKDNKVDYCPDGSTHTVVTFDSVNGAWYLNWFNNEDEALDYLMITTFNTNKTVQQIENNKDDPCYVFEKDGKLYNNWVYYDKVNQYTQLFKDYTDDKPHTLLALRQYLKAGKSVCCHWSTRAPIYYIMLPIDEAKRKFEERNKSWENEDMIWDFDMFEVK